MAEKKMGIGFGVMILNSEGKVLLGKRHTDPEKASSLLHGAGKWTMPGGKLNFGESFEEGAARETLEETGIKIQKLKLISINNDVVETAHFVTAGFLCNEFEGETKVMEPEEITEWKWFDLSSLPENLFFPTAKVLKNYEKGEIYIPEE